MQWNYSPNPARPLRTGVSRFFVASLLAGFSVLAPCGTAQAPAKFQSALAKHGSEIFQKRCVACHNKQPGDDAPFGPPNLYTAFHRNPPLTVHDAETTIRDGKGTMPAFGTILSPGEIRSVITYLRTREPQSTEKPE